MKFLNLEASCISVKILLIILLGESVGLYKTPEGLFLKLLLHLDLAQVEEELVSTFDLSTCLFNQPLNLTNCFLILICSTS